jgi:NTP pyrophosphatase (non-canonical NTP hydrolase)
MPLLGTDRYVIRGEVQREIRDERDRQDDKWGGWDRFTPPFVFSAVLGEEYGEVCHALLEGDDHNLREELIQVAAVAMAWVEQIEREQARAEA